MSESLCYTTKVGGVWQWAPQRDNDWEDVIARATVNITRDDSDAPSEFIPIHSACIFKQTRRWDLFNGVTL